MSKRSNTFPYTNAARAGRTEHGKIEMRDACEELRTRESNRAARRRRGTYRGFLAGSAYRRVRSLRTLGQHPGQVA